MWNTSLVPIQWAKPHDATKMPQLLCVKLEDPKKFTSQALRRSRAVIHLPPAVVVHLAWGPLTRHGAGGGNLKKPGSTTRATSTLAYSNPSPSSHGSEMVKSDRRGLILTKPNQNHNSPVWRRDGCTRGAVAPPQTPAAPIFTRLLVSERLWVRGDWLTTNARLPVTSVYQWQTVTTNTWRAVTMPQWLHLTSVNVRLQVQHADCVDSSDPSAWYRARGCSSRDPDCDTWHDENTPCVTRFSGRCCSPPLSLPWSVWLPRRPAGAGRDPSRPWTAAVRRVVGPLRSGQLLVAAVLAPPLTAQLTWPGHPWPPPPAHLGTAAAGDATEDAGAEPTGTDTVGMTGGQWLLDT